MYNDGVFADFTAKEVAVDAQIHVEHGRPLVFGEGRTRGLRLDPARLTLETVTIGADGVSEADLMVHDETNRTLATMLAALEMPVALGVLYCDPAPSYETSIRERIDEAIAGHPGDHLNGMLRRGHTWAVSG